MLSISHVATASFIAAKVSNPLLAVPLIFASHYLEDLIPHWDVGTGLSTGKRKRMHAFMFGIIDMVMAFVIVYLFWQVGKPTWQTWIFAGGLIGLIPDLLEAPRNFFKTEPAILQPINQFHNAFHHSIPNKVVGLLPQVVLLVVIFLLK